MTRSSCCLMMAVAAALLGPNAGGSRAQAFPSKPITLVVPFPPGGATDPVARMMGAKITESTGQPFLVVNRPGAASIIGAEAVKRAPPDGYTLFFGHFGSHAVNQHVYSKLSYDPIADFAPITPVMSIASLLVVPGSSPARTVAELVALAKSRPDGLVYASQGIASGGHLLGEMLRARTGIRLTHVPYKGAAAAVQDILVGRVDLVFDAPSNSGAHIKDGKLRALGVTAPARSPLFPEVPTMAEAGYPSVELVIWFGIFAPAGTPQPVIRRLHTAFVQAVRNPDVSRKLAGAGLDVYTLATPEAFAALIAADTLKYGQIVRDAGIKAD
ncbi:MAG: tripartite tricarboxylate transporter substrate binding protein [Burkholderiales bacterium]|nr:tripartite tricarboxylate transporter substrate binding protein [Burkholderiales bacterium]